MAAPTLQLKARDVLKVVPPLGEGDSAETVVTRLRDYRVAIRVDADGKPASVLTSCDVDWLTERLAEKKGTQPTAKDLLEPKYVFQVTEEAPLEEVAREISRRKLATGITVVDAQGKYIGYAYTEEVRAGLEELMTSGQREVDARINRLKTEYPDAWPVLSRRLMS